MPLLKLWNSICGNTSPTSADSQSGDRTHSSQTQPAQTQSGQAKSGQAKSRPPQSGATQSRQNTRRTKSKNVPTDGERKSRSRHRDQGETRILAKPTKPTRNLLDMMSRGSHASICRLVKRSGATSILEIGVGDGKRALSVTKALIESNPGTIVRYAAIDMFEMADGPITLKDFNLQLRNQGVQATLVPMEITPGIARVSSTIGVVDLVLIGDNQEDVELTTTTSALKRVSSANTSVFRLVSEKWERLDPENQLNNRRAA